MLSHIIRIFAAKLNWEKDENNHSIIIMKVKDKVFLVTGGANGMGRELVLNLAKKGAMVVAADINQQGDERSPRHVRDTGLKRLRKHEGVPKLTRPHTFRS